MRSAPILAWLWPTLAAGLAAAAPPTRDAAIAEMRPYSGPSVAGIPADTLTGKVLCGYQGWFTAPGDGAELGWKHYERGGRLSRGSARSICGRI